MKKMNKMQAGVFTLIGVLAIGGGAAYAVDKYEENDAILITVPAEEGFASDDFNWDNIIFDQDTFDLNDPDNAPIFATPATPSTEAIAE